MDASSSFIISHPERQSDAQRTLFRVLTAAIWMLWSYLWLPLITALLWMFGIHTAYVQVFRGTRGISLQVVLWIMLASAALVIYWSNYNRIRYAKSTRRKRIARTSKVAIGEKFGV